MITLSMPDPPVDTDTLPATCDHCGIGEDRETTGDFETLERRLCRATQSSPAEYEDVVVCPACAAILTRDRDDWDEEA